MEEKDKIFDLYRQWSGKEPGTVRKLPGSGSYRTYYRITDENESVLLAVNEDVQENLAFISFTMHFTALHLPVPEILAFAGDKKSYLLTDLGDQTLFDLLSAKRTGNEIPSEIIDIYKRVLEWLPSFQIRADKGLDYSKCYPRNAFDRQSMHWDLNYFKYYFLKLAKVPFDEQKLEDDFTELMNFLEKAPADYFLYRDFQSRNIMLKEGSPYFIDYQGGRKGALQYDVASLLFDGKAAIPPETREMLLTHYMKALDRFIAYDHDQFRDAYNGFVLIRILQAMGAYGFRGYYEKKTHFLQSIPFAVNNLEYLLKNDQLPEGLPVIRNLLTEIIHHPDFRKTNQSLVEWKENLKVNIFSFSYKKGIPADPSGHGGGFVFDCRALPNPGRYPEYSKVSGKGIEVIDFLKKEMPVARFLENVFQLVDQSVEEYLKRGFSSLSVGFGCTGGQHRSVYCAEKLAGHLVEKHNVKVEIIHHEKDNWLK
ncbi:MAG: phosphotransferase [Syntrophothermus sp.]